MQYWCNCMYSCNARVSASSGPSVMGALTNKGSEGTIISNLSFRRHPQSNHAPTLLKNPGFQFLRLNARRKIAGPNRPTLSFQGFLSIQTGYPFFREKFTPRALIELFHLCLVMKLMM